MILNASRKTHFINFLRVLLFFIQFYQSLSVRGNTIDFEARTDKRAIYMPQSYRPSINEPPTQIPFYWKTTPYNGTHWQSTWSNDTHTFQTYWNGTHWKSEYQFYIAAKSAPTGQINVQPTGTLNPTPTQPPFTNVRFCVCGQHSADRIIGGKQVDEHEYPWMAALVDVNNNLICGGSLINDRYVLTAGHCFINNVNKPYWVLLGSSSIQGSNTIKFSIEKIIIHPSYDTTTKDSDIALVRISPSVRMTKVVSPICLPQSNFVNYENQFVRVSGWGKVSPEADSGSDYLRASMLRVVSNQECTQRYEGTEVTTITQNMICAALPDRDSCQGDSGGPLFKFGINGKGIEQLGIVAFGIGCANKLYPGVYTRVSQFTNWIYVNTQIARYCKNL